MTNPSCRYLMVHVQTERSKLTQQEVATYFNKAVQKYYGDFGAASIGNFSIKYFNEKSRLLVVRVSEGPHRFLASILPLLTKVRIEERLQNQTNFAFKSGNVLANYQILYTGATIRQCKRHIVKYQNNFIRQT